MTYKEFTAMTLADFQKFANVAAQNGELEDFLRDAWEAIAIERGNHHADNMTKVVNNLEQYKRQVGRRYDLTHNTEYKDKYNELEDQIQYLTKTYEAKRLTKPYYLR